MRTLASILTVIVPLAASAQTLPAKPFQPPAAELELVYLLTFGDIATQRPGEEKMKVQLYDGTEENGAIGSFEISKIGHCRYQALIDITAYNKTASSSAKGATIFDFSKTAMATIKPEDNGFHEVTFSGSSGIVSDMRYVRIVLDDGQQATGVQTETEEDFSLFIGLKHRTVNPEAYRIAAQEFSSRFCKGFQIAGP